MKTASLRYSKKSTPFKPVLTTSNIRKTSYKGKMETFTTPPGYSKSKTTHFKLALSTSASINNSKSTSKGKRGTTSNPGHTKSKITHFKPDLTTSASINNRKSTTKRKKGTKSYPGHTKSKTTHFKPRLDYFSVNKQQEIDI